jgi:type III secretory pathway component EscU
MIISFEQLMEIVEKAITIVAILAIYRSFPADKVRELFESLREPVKKSESPIDDALYGVAEQLYNLIQAKQVVAPAAPVVTTTTTTSEPLYNPAEADRS